MIAEIWLYLWLVATCMASGLPSNKQSILLRAMLSDDFTDESFSPSVTEFMRYHFAPQAVSLPVHALILEHKLDRSNPDLLAKVMEFTGYEASKATRIIQVWFRYCIDRGECEQQDNRMKLNRKGVRSYTERIIAALPASVPVDVSKETTSIIEDLVRFASYEKLFAVPNWMFRLMEFHVESSLPSLVALIYASSSEYSQDEIWTIVKIWRQFCLLERQSGVYFYCYMGDADIWHLDEIATIPRIKYAIQHPEESVAPSQAAIEFQTLAAGVEMFTPGVFVDAPLVPSSLVASESSNEQTVSLKRLTRNSDESPENDKRRKVWDVQRTPTTVTSVETSSPSASMGKAFQTPSSASIGNMLLAGWKLAYDVADADMGIVLSLINVMLFEPNWSPTTSAESDLHYNIKRPMFASREFVALVETNPHLPVSELGKIIVEREPASDISYRDRKRTMFCIIVWRKFGKGAILNSQNNYHLNPKMLLAYLTALGKHMLPPSSE